jgi:hypothetical protein
MAKPQVGQIIDLITLSKTSGPVGEVRKSILDFTAFQAENLGIWMPLDGRSCAGTEYQALTGNAIVPDAVTSGAFIRQATGGRAVGSFEVDTFASHTHGLATKLGGSTGSAPLMDGGGASSYTTQATGGSETRPKNIALHFYIKVGH